MSELIKASESAEKIYEGELIDSEDAIRRHTIEMQIAGRRPRLPFVDEEGNTILSVVLIPARDQC
jgi:hypothetical protein